ncbi:HAAS signaling domain-containing protein [Geodermatophilus sp. SYSU D01105]
MQRSTTSGVQSYCDALLLAMRARVVPGRRIGEVLAEVESHVAETGEDPHQAFGPPQEYADRVAEALGIPRSGTWAGLARGLGWADLVGAVVIGVCCFLLADGSWSLGAGTDGVLGLPAGVVTVAAALVLGASVVRTVRSVRRDRDDDAVVDPRTGRDMVPFGGWRLALLTAVPVVSLAAVFVGGLVTGS